MSDSKFPILEPTENPHYDACERIAHADDPLRGELLEKEADFLTGRFSEESKASLKAFLNAFCRKSAWDYRIQICFSPDYFDILKPILDPIMCIFVHPSEMPKGKRSVKAASRFYARKARNWLRAVIVNRDFAAIEALKKMMERLPEKTQLRPRMTVDELVFAIPKGETSNYKKKIVYDVFEELCFESSKLPSKKKLREEVEKRFSKSGTAAIDTANWTKTLKALGLDGLPVEKGRDKQ